MLLQGRGGRQRIVAPAGSEIAPANDPQPDGTLVNGARAGLVVAGLLDEGSFTSASEISEAEGSSKSYVYRVLQLTLLAPDIAERILDGRPTVGLPQLLRPIPVEWERQRRQFS